MTASAQTPSLTRQLAAVELAAKPTIARDGMKRSGMREEVIAMQVSDLEAAAVTLRWLHEHRDVVRAVAKAVNDNTDPFRPIGELAAEIVSHVKRGAQ